MASTALKPFLMNRNPRNLERLRYAWKIKGYQLEKDAQLKSFYYKFNTDLSTVTDEYEF